MPGTSSSLLVTLHPAPVLQSLQETTHKPTHFLPPVLQVAKDLYYDMVLGREFEEMCAQMYYRGKMFGFVHLYSGQVGAYGGAMLRGGSWLRGWD